MKTCSVEGCSTKARSMGMCSKHYQKSAKYGDPLATAIKPFNVRFWEKVDQSGECWIWMHSKDRHGYGKISKAGNMTGAHRISYEMKHGPIDPGLVVDHMCYNKSCVNPAHLQAVTQKENQENRSGVQRNSTSGIRGVTWHKAGKKWTAYVTHEGLTIYLGMFDEAKDAEAAVIAKRNELFTNSLMDRRAAA